MANTSRLATLLVRIAGDADDLDADLDAGMARAEGTVSRWGDRIGTAADMIGAGVGAGLAAGVVNSFEAEGAGDRLAAKLGATGDQAAALGRIQGDVYASGWGESLDDVGATIASITRNVGEGNDAWLQDMTSKTLAFSSTFEQDMEKITGAVGQMLNTGMAANADEAFDILTKAMQGPANKADDLMDTVNEYSVQWQRAGLDGKTAIGMITQAMAAGARDSDQVADAIGQFGELALAGGSSVESAFSSIGLSADEMAAKIGQGGPAAAQALQQTLDALRGTKDEQVRLNAATALFGDPGAVMADALFAMDPATAAASAGLDNVAGATDRMSETVSSNPAAAFEQFKRTAVQKLGEVAGSLVTFGMQNQGFVQPLVIALGVLAGAILAVRVGTTAWTAAQTAWRVATAIGTAAQWAFNAAMSANPVSLIIIAVVALTAGIVALYMKSETAREIINGAFSGIWTAIQFVYNWVRDNWPLLLQILTGPIGFAVAQIVKHWDSIRNGVSAVLGWVRDNWPLLLSILTGPIGAAVIQIVTHWTEIKNAGIGVLNWFKELPGNLTSALSTIGEIILSPFKAAFNGVARAWNNSVGKVGFSVPGWVPGLGGKSWSIPDIPLLAAGGLIRGGGPAVVGDAGPELLDLPRGARVTPLPRGVTSGGGGGQAGRVTIDVTGADEEFKRLIRRMVKVDGRGSVQTAFGAG